MSKLWQTKKLGDICDIYQPKTISAKDMLVDGEFPVFGANGIIGRYDKFNHEEPQLLITCRGATCGSVNISQPKSWITGNAMVIRSKNSSLDSRYLEYLFRGGIDVSKIITGSAQPQITRASLEPVLISYPEDQEEQKRIVKILDEAFEKIAKAKENAEKNLQNSKELFDSYLERVFKNPDKDWEEKKLYEICTKITDGVHKKPVYLSEGIPFIKINNLTDGPGISFRSVSYISAKDHEEFSKRTKPEKGDILITKDGTIGIVKVVETDIEFSIFVSVALIKPISKRITPYLRYVLESPIIQGQIKPKGAALKHLYLKDLRQFIIPIPPTNVQDEIVKKLNSLSEQTKKLEANYKQRIADLDELKKSLLNKAFAGEL